VPGDTLTPEHVVPVPVPVPVVVLLKVRETLALAVRPPLSVARAVTVCAPLGYAAVLTADDQDDVPLARTNAPASTRTSTLETATLSAATPLTGTTPLTVVPD
jgi:hypothetical protein